MIEIFYALKLLAQLTFNKEIRKSINETKEYKKSFENSNYHSQNFNENHDEKLVYSSICRVIENIEWNLNTEHRQSNVINQSLNNQQQHIMISYHSSTLELCIKIKHELESMGYKVWMNLDKLSESSIESMKNAIEKSFCVLMCVNEKYRQSIYCQVEVKYAVEQKKPMISLIMQPECEEQKGWLGFIMSNKMFVHFMKPQFEECIKILNAKINDTLKKVTIPNEIKENTSNSTIDSNQLITSSYDTKDWNIAANDLVKNWTEARVNEWFIQNDLSLLIFEHFKPCNGKILKQMFDMKKNAAEFYFKSLSEIKNLKFKAILPFSACLDDLFELK